jgi:hypothetical protein
MRNVNTLNSLRDLFFMILGDSYLELGAQWLHGEVGNPIYEFSKKHQLLDEIEETSQFLNRTKNDEDLTYQASPILNYLIGKL